MDESQQEETGIMNQMASTSFQKFESLVQLMPDEKVSVLEESLESFEDVAAPVLILTLKNDSSGKIPVILGPQTLINIGTTLADVSQRLVQDEDIYSAVIIRSKGPAFVAGANLSMAHQVRGKEAAQLMVELGHTAIDILDDLPIPTFAFLHGAAIGGGLELALAADFRIVSESVNNISLPEAFLGLLPGWGGTFRLPMLIGPEAAFAIMIDNPLNNNKVLTGPQAVERNIGDVLLAAEDFYNVALDWVHNKLSSAVLVPRPSYQATDEEWDVALEKARQTAFKRTRGIPPAPEKLIEVAAVTRLRDRSRSKQAQIDVLGDLMNTPEFRNTVYAFMDLLQARARRPLGAPSLENTQKFTKVGIVGAGLMATQLAVLFAQQLQVPIVLSDVSDEAVTRGMSLIANQLDQLQQRGRITDDQKNQLTGLISADTDKSIFADTDFVIEAVFEELEIKKQVFREIEAIVSDDCILATNTSSLSVSKMASVLKHPHRLIGFHFFNPVSAMKLVEIVKTEYSDEASLAAAFQLAKDLRKTPILVKDATAFAVNRVLLRLMSDVQKAFDEGTEATVTDHALDSFGLPMSPFDLLALVGLPVAQHVNQSLFNSFGNRFHVSENIQKLIDQNIKSVWATGDDGERFIPESTSKLLVQGSHIRSAQEVRDLVFEGLAQEIGMLLQEGVVAGPEEVDLGMILGAGWPLYRGGITPFLDDEGYSEKVLGKRFHP